MASNLLDMFSLRYEKEDYKTVVAGIESGVSFRGTNLWILIFAIFVASLGLNVNSTAVIIGAMLISPLMGPIMGMGLGIGTSDFVLFRRSVNNLVIATIAALATSTLFFLVSPLNDAHSEILARTAPNIYDVLIALSGGSAGIIATSSRQKGNVIPGVAIATALMPPLCTAGYGLATLQLNFFIGAFYLYLINMVFIGLATLVVVRMLHFPQHVSEDVRKGKIARRIAGVVVLLTLTPSVYFGYDLVQRNRFEKNAARFIATEAKLPNDYLLSKKVDGAERTIALIYGGDRIDSLQIESLRKKLVAYGLTDTKLEVGQGFSLLDRKSDNMTPTDPKLLQLSEALEQERKKADSVQLTQALSAAVYQEIKAQYPGLRSAIITPVVERSDSTAVSSYLVLLNMAKKMSGDESGKLDAWLKVRLKTPALHLIIN